MEVILQSIDLNSHKIVFSTEGAREQQTASLAANKRLDFPSFRNSISAALGRAPPNGTDLFYFDDEGDKIFVGSESELAEALRQLQQSSPEPADLPLQKNLAAANKPELEKARQAKREKLSQREEALGNRIKMLEKRIDEIQWRKGELEKLRASVRQQLENIESPKEGEASKARVPRQQAPNRQQLVRQREQLEKQRDKILVREKQRDKILVRLEPSQNQRRLRLITERIATIERSLNNSSISQ